MKEDLIEKIIAEEWKQFDQVNNEGGRASCQDNWPTFHIMRKSQFDNWNERKVLFWNLGAHLPCI